MEISRTAAIDGNFNTNYGEELAVPFSHVSFEECVLEVSSSRTKKNPYLL